MAQVSVRAEARTVGLRVLRRAAAERAREEAAAKERRLVNTQLHHLGEASQASKTAATPKGHCRALPATLTACIQTLRGLGGCLLSTLLMRKGRDCVTLHTDSCVEGRSLCCRLPYCGAPESRSQSKPCSSRAPRETCSGHRAKPAGIHQHDPPPEVSHPPCSGHVQQVSGYYRRMR